uniref:NAD(P)(+)--arginine ADP-ribosyltransferase n=1 Tax=Chrysemys picta bellii TaxID=8478 RepID=A0A8C3F8G7_CHRPI
QSLEINRPDCQQLLLPAGMPWGAPNFKSMGRLPGAAMGVSRQPSTPRPVLDMAFNAFDDQYIGCTEVMENIIKSKLLRQEKLRHKVFSKRWEAAKKQWNNNKKNLSLPRGFKDENGIAILAYTSGGEIPLYQEFNKAVREAGKSRAYYLKHFPFKALHFYLTRALQLLKRDCAEMYEMEVYRGVRSLRYQPGKRGGMVRFGTFASSSLDRNVAHRFGSATFFTIRTCFGVPIADFSYIRDEEEVLIPVYERFRVCNFTQDKNSNLFVLHSTNRTFSRYNCSSQFSFRFFCLHFPSPPQLISLTFLSFGKLFLFVCLY